MRDERRERRVEVAVRVAVAVEHDIEMLEATASSFFVCCSSFVAYRGFGRWQHVVVAVLGIEQGKGFGVLSEPSPS